MMLDDVELFWRVIRMAVQAGRLPGDVERVAEIQVTAPSVAVRDRKVEAEVSQTEFEAGILSPQTWSMRSGLDYAQEQRHLAAHGASHDAEATKRVADNAR